MLRADERPHGVRGDRSEGCGSGFWGGRRLSLADYVTGTDAHARGVLVLLPLEPGGLGRGQSEPVRLGPDEGEGGGKVLTLDGQL